MAVHSSPITIEVLQVLDAIDQRGSYASAAEQLNKVPSSLSYLIQKLEEQLGVTLFQRQGRRAVLTPAGKHLLHEGRKVLAAINTLSEQTQTIANGWEPKIRIALDSILDNHKVFAVLHTFLQQYPNIEIDIQETVLNGTWEALVNDEVDLVIGATGPVPSQKGIRAVQCSTLHRVLVAHKDHTLTKKQAVEPAELEQHRSIIVHDSAKYEVTRSINVINSNQHFYVSSIQQKIAAIVEGIGIGYLPRDLIEARLASGEIKMINLTEELPELSLYKAWKLTNKGKGLAKLNQMLGQV